MHILDRYSTETLLNIEVLWHNNQAVREKWTELKLKDDPLDCEENRFVRKLIKKYGIHRGLSYMTFITVAVFAFIGSSLYHKAEAGLFHHTEALVWCSIVAFLLGLITHQFVNALKSKKHINEVKKELEKGGGKN